MGTDGSIYAKIATVEIVGNSVCPPGRCVANSWQIVNHICSGTTPAATKGTFATGAFVSGASGSVSSGGDCACMA